MTGERMETVREALEKLRGVTPALAEVERWERDRARLADALERLTSACEARVVLAHDPGRLTKRQDQERTRIIVEHVDATEAARALLAALGEGQDSDLAAAGSASGNDGSAGIATPDGTTERVSRPDVPAAARSSECPCDGDRGCVCQ